MLRRLRNVLSGNSDSFNEYDVCDITELKEGVIKEVKLGDQGKALVSKWKSEIHAISNKCTHYGLPLTKGSFSNGRLRCPFHGACFNIITGDIEDFPGLDSLHKFETSVSQTGMVKIKVAKTLPDSFKRCKETTKRNLSNPSVFLMIGGGVASVTAAETLRQQGFDGRLIIATNESCLPYDRPKLSKVLNSDPDVIKLRSSEFYSSCDTEVLLDKEATYLDRSSRLVKFSDGTSINYDKLFIGTGGIPRAIGDVPGNDAKNIFTLRSPFDGAKILNQSAGSNVVILGSGFISMELASTLVSGKSPSTLVTVISRDTLPFKGIFGEQIGEAFLKLHESKGISFIPKNGIKEFVKHDDVTDGGKLKQVILNDGRSIDADVCIIAIGVSPATDFVKESGLDLTATGHIKVDQYMRSLSDDNIFAGGDVAQFPLNLNDVEIDDARIGHFGFAGSLGNVAAVNMLKYGSKPLKTIPYFWTQQYGKSLRYCGFVRNFSDVIIHGNLDIDALKFVAYFIKGERVHAVASVNWDPIVSTCAEAMHSGYQLTKDDVRDDPESWIEKFKEKSLL